MDKETVEKKLKYELELLKIYVFLIAATATGAASLILRGNLLPLRSDNPEVYLFMFGIIFFITFAFIGLNSIIRIKRLYRKL